ncbi:unnamed protein product, partial [Thlaspi arvense]
MWRRSFSTTGVTLGQLGKKKWDAVVIGGGHNGLIAAAYLARGGLSVAVLERRHVIGGAAVTEEIVPGFKFSRCSYLQSLMRPCIIRELELGKHGLKLLKRNPSSFTPCLDGRYLLLGPDQALNHSEISKFSSHDADAYPRYEKQLERFCGFMDPLLDATPPESLQGVSSFNDKLSNKLYKSAFWARCLRQAACLGQKDMGLHGSSIVPSFKSFEQLSDVLKATLATDAVIGSTASVHTPGSGYVLLHHVMGETDGEHGIWSYVEGGMGSVSMAIANAAKEAGAQIFTNAEVSEVLTEDSSIVKGVLLADGTRVESSVILSNATPYRTFVELVPTNVLPEKFVDAIKNSDYSSATTKINLAVDKLPQFRCCNTNNNHSSPGPEHFGTIHIGAERMDFSSLNVILCIGKHVINLFIQYTPYKPSDGSWDDPEAFAQRCFKLIDEYAPGFSSSIISYDMLTPPDLEREIGLTGGNIFHGAMGLDSLFLMRPVKGWSNYRSPLKGLYLCGSGAHPGGGVMGAPGRNAAHLVLQDLK